VTVESATPANPHLLKILGVTFGVAVAVGEIIGSGILRSPSIIANTVPSVSLILGLWILCGVHSWLGANVFAELGTAMPRTGGPYIFARRAYGDVAGLVVGWSNWLAKLAGIAAASVSFAEFLPLIWPAAGQHKIAVATALQLALYGANITGLREGRAVQETTTLIKSLMFLIFIVIAAVIVVPPEPQRVLPLAPTLQWVSIVLAYKLIIGAYAGWPAPLFFSGENVAPEKSIPKALFYGVIITAALYIAINAALLHALGLHGVAASPLPFMTVLGQFGGPLPSLLFALTALVTVASCANANIMSSPRILFALAEDGLLPRIMTRLNSGGSPTVSFLFTAVGTIVLAASGEFALVFGLIATLNTVSAVVIESGYFVLRRREPTLARPFRAIGYPLLPALVLALDTALLVIFVSADRVGTIAAVGMVLLCIPFAFFMRRAAVPPRPGILP
jgi:amino acid transporter